MTIVVFLVDTSASMNQRSYLGTSFLDITKAAIESFLKAGWRESQATFQTELRNLKAAGTTELGPALGNALQLLNINRLQSGIDNYGQGRYPHWLEPAVILTFTDGDRLSPTQAVPNPKVITVPAGSSLGSELTVEPFRWDQRIFGIVLRLPGHQPKPPWQPNQMIPSDGGPLDVMCEVTGGRSYAVRSHKALNQCLESLAGKMQSGIVVSLEKFGPDPPALTKEEALTNGYPEHKPLNGVKTEAGMVNGVGGEDDEKSRDGATMAEQESSDRSWESTRRMLFVPRTIHKGYQGFWPMPEAFWPNVQASALQPRTAHPVLRFTCDGAEPALLSDFPWDKYELEPSPLTLAILNRKQPNVVWQVFMEGSGRDANSIVSKAPGLGSPFGYLKASSDGRTVSLFLLPYNYPALFPLIEELRTKLKGKPSGSWRLRFETYLRAIPPYYYEPLRKAMARLNFANVMPDRSQDMVFSYSVSNYLQRAKYRAKEEFERMVSAVQARAAAAPVPGYHRGVALLRPPSVEGREDWAKTRIFLRNPTIRASGFRNAFDIPRSSLISHIQRMRLNVSHELSHAKKPSGLSGGLPGSRLSLAAAELLHELPVANMGSYQEYLSRQHPPLRELEAAPIRAHAFGNPFKIDKNLKNVDEINLDGPSGAMGGPNAPAAGMSRGPKRGDLSRRPSSYHKRKGLPKGYKYKRRRVSLETGEVVSDSGWETDSSVASTSSAPPSPIPPPAEPPGSPPRKRPKLGSPPKPPRSPSPSLITHPAPPNTIVHEEISLFKDKTQERISRLEEAGGKSEARKGLSRDAILQSKRGIAAIIRSTGPPAKKVVRLRELWEWGVTEASDRGLLLDFAIQEAGRFKAASLVALLRSDRDALPS